MRPDQRDAGRRPHPAKHVGDPNLRPLAQPEETLAVVRHVAQQLRRLEPVTERVAQVLQIGDAQLQALLIEEVERSAQERREAETEHRARVAVQRRADYPFGERPGRLVDERPEQATPDQGGRHVTPAVSAQQRVDVRVDAAGLTPLVYVETAAAFASEQARFEQRSSSAQLQAPLGEQGCQHLVDAAGHVQAVLIDQFQRPDGEACVTHDLVYELDPGAFPDQLQRLADVGRQHPVDIETRPVLHDDHALALSEADVHGGLQGSFGCRLRPDDLEQRHLLHRREVVHADYVAGPAGTSGDFADGDRAGVAGEHVLVTGDGFHLGEHRLLQFQLLGYRFDGEVGSGSVAERAGQPDPFEDAVAFERGQAAADAPGQVAVDGAPAFAREFKRAVVQQYRQAGGRGTYLGDA